MESVPEREFKCRQQRLAFLVGAGGGCDGDVHAAQGVDLVVFDLGENDMLFHAEIEIAAAVERLARDAAVIADTRNRDGVEAIEELVHARAAQGHLAPNRVVGAGLEYYKPWDIKCPY